MSVDVGVDVRDGVDVLEGVTDGVGGLLPVFDCVAAGDPVREPVAAALLVLVESGVSEALPVWDAGGVTVASAVPAGL